MSLFSINIVASESANCVCWC